MMELLFKDTKVNYYTIGNGEELVVFLHGWGAGSETILPLANNLQNEKYTLLLIDFPPFEKSEEPKEVWILEDYVNLTYEIILKCKNELNLKKIDLIAHSFGGRVALHLASSHASEINKLILLGSAGIKPKRGFKYLFNITKYKILKKISPKKALKMGSNDYKKLSNIMKATFINIVNSDCTQLCKKVECKTLIIFGKNDKETPIYMAKKLNKLIKSSQLIIIDNAGHFVYLDNLPLVFNFITLFLNS